MTFNWNPELVVATITLVAVVAQMVVPALDPKKN